MQCPFLETVKPTIVTALLEEESSRVEQQQEMRGSDSEFASNKSFPYDKFFKEQILRKKMDHSYRIFKKVARFAQQPPFAQDFASLKKEVMVWCSNDYLGMTTHPKVRTAVM